MAVDSATPGKRNRVPDGPAKAQEQGDMSPAHSLGLKSPMKTEKSAQSEIQVPSTLPDLDQAGKPQEERVKAGAEKNESKTAPEDLNSDLPPFDFNGIQDQYTAAIGEASQAEDQLLHEFDAYAQVFCSFPSIKSSANTVISFSVCGLKLRQAVTI